MNVGLEVPHADRFNTVEIHGTEGTLAVDHAKERVTVHGSDGDSRTRAVADGDAVEAQMRAFVRAVTADGPTRSDGGRERDTLAVVEAGYESIDTGEAARVDRRGD